MAALECKLPMVINRLVLEFELLMELKFEQKRVLYCIPRVKVSVTDSTRTVRLSVPVIYSDIRSYNERDLAILVNSFQALAPLTGQKKGVHFLREHISLKNGTFCPLLATIQALSRTRVFLLSENKRRLLCMGRTSTANKPFAL
jgi:hypothetical protein